MKLIAALVICLKIISLFEDSVGSTISSWEHRIRADLLRNYDRKVRPVLKGKREAEVLFALRISRLVKVDNKEQVVVLDTWVIQSWRNEFLTWNSSKYGDLQRVHFSPEEIWVPDTALFNNGDDKINLAGGPTKFVTDVSVNNKGKCVWSGPATFKVNCEMKVDEWPFDEQTCELAFGSFSYGKNLLRLKLFKEERRFTNRFVKSGDWEITNITAKISETDHGNCCRFNFSEVVYTLEMKRKYLYYMFYLFTPTVLLTILALSSFLIHVESGERIGFVTTILLAMTVFLLLIPSFLPVTSDGIPILGINLQVTMILIAAVLFANIFVLRVYFKEGTPPNWMEKLCSFKKGSRLRRIHLPQPDSTYPLALKSSMTTGIEASECTRTPAFAQPLEVQEFTWRRVSARMDLVFFVLFIIASSIAYALLYSPTDTVSQFL